jgi:hypothetical protein
MSISPRTIANSTTINRTPNETMQSFLKRLTHVRLQKKNIKKLDGIENCESLQVIYLYDNLIERIDILDKLKNLQFIQLQSNCIRTIPDLNLPLLTKLYLDNNEISYISGLEKCINLEELSVSKQKLPSEQSLQFDPTLLSNISNSLKCINTSSNNLSILSPFSVLVNLEVVDFSGNNIGIDEIYSLLESLTKLKECDFRQNPSCDDMKYREKIINKSNGTLEMLDGKEVFQHVKVGIKSLYKHIDKLNNDTDVAIKYKSHVDSKISAISKFNDIVIGTIHNDQT